MQEWDMELGREPLKVQAQRISAGRILMGNSDFDAHCDGMQFDRAIQKPMLKQIKLDKWCIMYGRNCGAEANQLKETFKKAANLF